MRSAFWALCTVTLAFHGLEASIIQDKVISYDGFKVLRVEVPEKADFEALENINYISFWNDGKVGGHADVMVKPDDLARMEADLYAKNLKFSVMIENVADLIKLEKVTTC